MMALFTSPGLVQVSTLDDPITITCDATTLPLATGETVTGVKTSLTELTTGDAVTLSGVPTFTTTSAAQSLYGSVLVAGKSYRLAWVFTLSSGDVLSEETTIVVVY